MFDRWGKVLRRHFAAFPLGPIGGFVSALGAGHRIIILPGVILYLYYMLQLHFEVKVTVFVFVTTHLFMLM